MENEENENLMLMALEHSPVVLRPEGGRIK